jgi:hypothetical protein
MYMHTHTFAHTFSSIVNTFLIGGGPSLFMSEFLSSCGVASVVPSSHRDTDDMFPVLLNEPPIIIIVVGVGVVVVVVVVVVCLCEDVFLLTTGILQ